MRALVLFLFLMEGTAFARNYDTYRSDYFKGAFCTAIGGACVADEDIITGIFQNPAALANGQNRWDFDGDYASRDVFEAGAKGNNGAADTSAVGGVAYSPGKWGAGIGFSWRRSDIDTPTLISGSTGAAVSSRLTGRAYTTQLRLPLAYYFNSGFSLGLTVAFTTQYQELELADPSQRVESSPGYSKIRFTAGTQVPLSPSLRLGSWLRFPVSLKDHIAFSSASTGVVNYREDYELDSPMIWGSGFSWSSSERWNLFAEADLIGSTEKGHLLSYASFSTSPAITPVEKGRSVVLEPHLGARYKITDKMKLHLGSFYENSRWEGTAGRLHGSVGLSHFVSVFELILGIDAARGYSQVFFTFR